MNWRDKWNAFLDKWLGEDACCHIEHSDLDDDTEELYDVSELDVRLNDPWSDDDTVNFLNPPWAQGDPSSEGG